MTRFQRRKNGGTKTISSERQAAFYIGMAMMVIGFLTFISVFVSAANSIGDFSNVGSGAQSSFTRALVGMGLMMAGAFVRSIGSRGLAGAGVVLDPEQAREDLEPYSRMAGGMVKDALDEADLDLGTSKERVVMIRCQSCGQLNEEDSKFCQECGKTV